MELSHRLKTVAGAVSPGNIVADIGTDHGYVPIYLVERGICPSALAMDVNAGPLERARDHIRQKGLEDRISLRLSDGLKNLSPGEVDSIVIAGMGGALICRILEDSPDYLTEGKELILSPQSEWFKVRRLLCDRGYRIVREWFLQEDGKYYLVIKALAKEQESQAERGTGPAPGPADLCQEELCQEDREIYYKYGSYLLEERNPAYIRYLQEERRKKEAIIQRMQGKLPHYKPENELGRISGKEPGKIPEKESGTRPGKMPEKPQEKEAGTRPGKMLEEPQEKEAEKISEKTREIIPEKKQEITPASLARIKELEKEIEEIHHLLNL